MKIEVREASLNDYIGIGSLIKNELGYHTLDYDRLYYRLKIILADKNHRIYTAICDHMVVGFVDLVRGLSLSIEGEYLQIVSIAVKTEYQHMGVGLKLIQKVKEYSQKNNFPLLSVSSGLYKNSDHAFLEQNGFRKTGYSFLRRG